MSALRIAFSIILAADCVALIITIIMQQSKSQGLGTIAGNLQQDTYWGKNKGRSKEGKLKLITRILAVAFVALALLLNVSAI